jgi:hypothetical protein
MKRAEAEIVEQFDAVSADGVLVIIRVVIWQDYVDTTCLRDTERRYSPGMQAAHTSDGRPLNVMPDGTFLELDTGRRFTRTRVPGA